MRFRFLVDHHCYDRIYAAGETEEMPFSFVPNGGCEPMDADATLLFWRCGPQPTPAVFNGLRVAAPKTRWEGVLIESGARWKLAGLGENLPDVCVWGVGP